MRCAKQVEKLQVVYWIIPGGGAFTRPTEVFSTNGFLDTSLIVDVTSVQFDWVSVQRRLYNGTFPGPTIRIKPNDRLHLNLVRYVGFQFVEKYLHVFVKGEPGELEFCFRKIPLHQQKFLVASVLSNSPWLPRYLKNGSKWVTKHFSVGNTFRQATMHARTFCICCAM